MFHDEYWKPIYFGVKVASHKNIAGVDICTLLSAGCSVRPDDAAVWYVTVYHLRLYWPAADKEKHQHRRDDADG